MTPATLAAREWWRPAAPAEIAHAAAVSKRSLVAFWALMFFMFVLLIAPQSIIPALGSLHLAAAAVVVAGTAHVAAASRTGQSLFAKHPSVHWAGALAAWALLTAPFSRWPGGTVSLLLELFFKSLVVFWLLGVVVDTLGRLKRFATWLSILTVPIGVTAIVHFATETFVEGGNEAAPRIMGYDAPLTANPNDLALVLCMMLPLAAALAVAERRRTLRLAFAAIACLDIVAVVLTFSRTGFLTLAVLGAVTLFKLRRATAMLATLGIVGLALVLVPLLPEGYLQHMGTITAIDTDPTGSAQSRWHDSLAAAKLVVADPILGSGAGMSTLALNEARGPSWVPVHNVYLEYATDLGLPGLLLFLLVLGSCFRNVTQILRRTTMTGATRDLRCLAQGVQMTLVAFVVAGFFHPVAYHFHFYYAAGLAVALAGVWENEHA